MNLTNLVEGIYKKLLESRILNRWFVLLIDMFIVVASTLIAYYITAKIYESMPGVQHPVLYRYLMITAGTTFLSFLLLKTNVGIIRYSTIHEFHRILTALLFSTVAIFFLMYFFEAPSGSVSISYCISFLLFSLLGLFFFRTTVIYIFRHLQSRFGGKVTEVFIWGVSEETISMSQYLNSLQSSYKVRGFIEGGEYSKLRKNTNLPVLTSDFRMAKYRVKNVLFATERSLRENQKAAEKLIKQGIHILVMQDVNINNLSELLEVSRSIRPIQIEDLLGRPEINISVESIFEKVSGKTILISGAAGSIGSEIVRQLAFFNPKLVVCLDQAETPLHELSLELRKTRLNYEIVVSDIRRLSKLSKVFEEYAPDIVYHAAAYKHVPLMENVPCEAVLANIMGTKHMVDLSIRCGVGMFVMISTDKAVNPTNIMGATKRIAEIYAQSCALDLKMQNSVKTKFVTTRFGNVLGSNGSVIPLFKRQIQNRESITVTHKDITRYFMTIPEACRLVLEASVIGKSGYIYIFDMGEPVRIYDLARRMIKLAGLVPDKDIKIEISGLRDGEKLYEELLNDSEITEDTSHEKIKVAKVRQYDLSEISSKIDEIIDSACCSDALNMVSMMKDLVPEFISQNSEFEVLDQEKLPKKGLSECI